MNNGFSKISDQDINFGLTVSSYIHQNGMRLELLNRSGFNTFATAVAIDAGGITTQFVTLGKKYEVPAGTAHFLEHCLFKSIGTNNSNVDLMNEMAKLGASVNAYTGTDRTVAYFATTTEAFKALFTFISGLAKPDLSDAFIESERKIILEELKQYRDDDTSRMVEAIMQGLYVNHPVRNDIGGTAETVAAITKHHLQLLFDAFYHPSRWVMTVVCDFAKHGDIKSLLRQMDEWMTTIDTLCLPKSKLCLGQEMVEPYRTKYVFEMEASPSFGLGIKLQPFSSGKAALAKRIAFETALNCLLSPSGLFYEELYSQGIINDSFGGFLNISYGATAVIMLGESKQPNIALDEIKRSLKKLAHLPLDLKLLERIRKTMLGDILRQFDSSMKLAHLITQEALNQTTLSQLLNQYDTIKTSDVEDALIQILGADQITEVELLPYASMSNS